MSTSMGNLEKLGILVIVILVVVVGVVAITPKSTVDERLYPDGQKPAEVAKEPEPLEVTPPGVAGANGGAPGTTDPWPGTKATTDLPGTVPGASDPRAVPGANPAVVPANEPPEPSFRMAKIQRGDTLALIAKRELGSAARYKEILEANPGLVATKLTAGKEIRIPVAPANPTAGGAKPVVPAAVPGGPTPLVPVPADTPAGEREYVVKKGDTLSSIASHEMGGASKWSELAKANEAVLHGSTALKIGMKLKIPAAGSSSSVASRDPATAGGADAATPPATAGAEREYVVRSGDSLWSIAKNEMGSEKKLSALKEANADVLKGSDALKVGMKLRIPAAK